MVYIEATLDVSEPKETLENIYDLIKKCYKMESLRIEELEALVEMTQEFVARKKEEENCDK